MSKNRFHRGMHLELQGREYVIEERLPNGDLRLRDIAINESKSFEEKELVNSLFDGRLVFLGDNQTTAVQRKGAELFVDDFNMLEEDDPRKKEARRRWAYVRAIVDSKLTKPNTTELALLIEHVHRETHDSKKAPYWKNVYYGWYMSYIKSGEDIRVLLPRYKKRGNTGRKFSAGRKFNGQTYSEKERALAKEVANIVDEIINEEYLTPERLSVSEIADRVEGRIADINLLRSPDDQLPIPHKNSVYNIVSRLDEYEKDSARYGKRYAEQKHRCNKHAPQPSRPLERTEIDHTKLDLFVVDEETRLPLGRAVLTNLLDKCSREVLGINVGFDPPSYLSVMRCIHHAINPKTYLKAEYPAVENDWEAYGLPEVIVVDNGKEFHSRSFEDACLQLGIVVMYSPPYHPRYKASIERFFGTQNKRLLHQQRGTTFSNIFERHDYDPAKNAVISFKAFMELVHVWIVDVYHQSYHSGLKDIPAHVWREGIKQFPPAMPRRMEELRVMLGHIEHRIIGPSGIELFTLFYNCEELARLRRKVNGSKEKIALKYDPSDLSVIYVYDKQQDRYIAVPALDQEYTKRLSLWQHKVIQSYARRDVLGRLNIDGLRRAKKKIQEIVEAEIVKGSKSGARTKVARWFGVRQPNYQSHLELQHQEEDQRELQDTSEGSMVLLNPNTEPFAGVSNVRSMEVSEKHGDCNGQSVEEEAVDASESGKRKGKKDISEELKRLDGADQRPNENDELDMRGFNSDYNLPKKGTKDDRITP